VVGLAIALVQVDCALAVFGMKNQSIEFRNGFEFFDKEVVPEISSSKACVTWIVESTTETGCSAVFKIAEFDPPPPPVALHPVRVNGMRVIKVKNFKLFMQLEYGI
jgi:hypothetical protein